jgi:hypothetical protein
VGSPFQQFVAIFEADEFRQFNPVGVATECSFPMTLFSVFGLQRWRQVTRRLKKTELAARPETALAESATANQPLATKLHGMAAVRRTCPPTAAVNVH